MVYGINNIGAWTVMLEAEYHDDYGELRTQVDDFTGLPSTDVSIQVALTAYNVLEPGTSDTAAIGIKTYVDDGQLFDAGMNDRAWLGNAFGYNITFYQVAYKLSANGGYMKGSHVAHYWGDTHDRPAKRTKDKPKERAIVFDPTTGIVRHVQSTFDLGGSIRPEEPLPGPIDTARALGHESDLDVITPTFEELGRVGSAFKVDLSTRALVGDFTT